MEDKNKKTAQIRELNDTFRRNPPSGILPEKTVVTQGISALPYDDQSFILARVRIFDDFTEDNDPHGEHDFGAFDHRGEKIFWKIDYYALDMKHGSENPADPSQTVRVLTIMLASEY